MLISHLFETGYAVVPDLITSAEIGDLVRSLMTCVPSPLVRGV